MSIDRVGVMSTSAGDIEAIQHLREAIAEGKHWYLALLEAIRLWSSPEEDRNGRHYRYLIDKEAFDWLVLAERLCEEVDGLIPENELVNFLFFDRPPIELSKDEFKELIGKAKYQAYLNYLYGVLVEEILILAVAEEIRKKKRVSGLAKDRGTIDEAYQHVYGATQQELVNRFRREKHYPKRKSVSIGEIKEFTYWLFKQRLKGCEKSRVASDTSKALAKLHAYIRVKGRHVSQPS
ncbi:MAG: hypothetical protein KAW00_04100 [Dehalococcoidia bacterium]|nr:hypothetical protein [Dehalococcoidia bacterium]